MPKQPHKSRRAYWIKLLSAMALILLTVFVVYRVVATRALSERIQAVRDAGHPIELEELNDWYVTPEVNAADVYLRAFAVYPMDHELEKYNQKVPVVSITNTKFVLGEPLDPQMAKHIEEYLTHFEDYTPLIEEAVRIKECRFPGDYREGIHLQTPHLGHLRRCSRVFKLRSILEYDRGEHDLAAQRCLTIIALGRSLENEPNVISGLVSISIQTLAYGQIEMLVTSGNISDDQLQDFTDAITPIDFEATMLRNMVGTRCKIHDVFSDTDMLADILDAEGALGRIAVAAWRTSGLLDIDHSSALDVMNDFVGFAENPSWPIPDKLASLDERVPRICVATRMVIPPLTAAHRASQEAEARRQTVLIGIAVERYRHKYGQYPIQLTELVHKFIDTIPLDPFDEQPMRYRVEDTGVIIYSVGLDGIDNLGRQYDERGREGGEDTDITFTFGGLQEELWPRPKEEIINWDDPYSGYGGYGDLYGDGESADGADESETENEPGNDADEAGSVPGTQSTAE